MNESNPEADGGESRADTGSVRLSAALRRIASQATGERVSIGDLLAALRDRALGALIFIFAAPIALPMPPGTSTIFAAPLLFLSAQLMVGTKPWLPRLITERSLSRSEFERLAKVVEPWLQRAENVMRPRLVSIGRPPFVNLLGLINLLLAIVLILPIPLGNMLPAIAMCIMALGLLAKDGLWMLVGVAVAVASVVVVWGVVGAMLIGAAFVLANVFGIHL